jgi:hypothetical protein
MPAYYGDFVTPTAYAQPADLAEYTQSAAPSNAVILLRSATRRVLDATNIAYYSVDATTGLPTDTQILNALRDATVIQAAAWAKIGYDPLAGGVQESAVLQSTKAGGSSDTFADAAAAAQARADAIKSMVPEALDVLRYNNLLIPNPWVFG